ncbi:MAG: hypothetical protein ACM3ZQ_02040 [Bacillota bacterium]
MRKTLPMIITTAIGLLMIADFFIKAPWIQSQASAINTWGIVISAFALGLGAANLVRKHSLVIKEKKSGWINSAALIISMAVMIIIGIGFGPKSANYQFLFNNILSPASATMYASIAFFITTSAYRAFSARSVEATVLLVSAVIVMLGRAPIGQAISPLFPQWTNWIMDVPNTAAMRAVMMGAALGVVATGVRTFLGYERSHLGGGGE